MLVPGRPKRQRLRRGTVCGNPSVSPGSQPSVWVAPTASRGPRLSLPRAPPTSLARILLGPCLGVRGRPRRGWQPGPGSRGLRPLFRCPAWGGGPVDVDSREHGSRVGLPLVPCRNPADPSVPGLTAPVPTTPWPAEAAVGHREWPRPLRSPPGPTTRRGVAGSPLSGSTGRSRPHPYAQTSTAS